MSAAQIRRISALGAREIATGSAGTTSSWHEEFRQSAYISIGGLHSGLTEGDVLAAASQFGDVVDILLPRDKLTAKPRGFCFLCFADQRSTDVCVDNLNGSRIGGRIVRVDHVKDFKVPAGEDIRQMAMQCFSSEDSDSDFDSGADLDLVGGVNGHVQQREDSRKSEFDRKEGSGSLLASRTNARDDGTRLLPNKSADILRRFSRRTDDAESVRFPYRPMAGASDDEDTSDEAASSAETAESDTDGLQTPILPERSRSLRRQRHEDTVGFALPSKHDERSHRHSRRKHRRSRDRGTEDRLSPSCVADRHRRRSHRKQDSVDGGSSRRRRHKRDCHTDGPRTSASRSHRSDEILSGAQSLARSSPTLDVAALRAELAAGDRAENSTRATARACGTCGSVGHDAWECTRQLIARRPGGARARP